MAHKYMPGQKEFWVNFNIFHMAAFSKDFEWIAYEPTRKQFAVTFKKEIVPSTADRRTYVYELSDAIFSEFINESYRVGSWMSAFHSTIAEPNGEFINFILCSFTIDAGWLKCAETVDVIQWGGNNSSNGLPHQPDLFTKWMTTDRSSRVSFEKIFHFDVGPAILLDHQGEYSF